MNRNKKHRAFSERCLRGRINPTLEKNLVAVSRVAMG
jgi:hypothetical protein